MQFKKSIEFSLISNMTNVIDIIRVGKLSHD